MWASAAAAMVVVPLAARGLGVEALSPVTTFAVPGRTSSTPWVAASGSFVAVAWGATAAGKSDVFLAVSRDSGAEFGPPVRVNTVAGEARLGGELPPRVALSRAGATPTITVLWTARGAATEVKVARSVDGGKTFGSPIGLQSSGAAGDRGWAALTVDERGAAHALWLDHRGLAKGSAEEGHAAHQPGVAHDGVAMAQRSGLYIATVGASSSVPALERELTKGVCYCCKTALVAGANGAIYAAWRHVYPDNLRDIAFTVSRDGGRTFSAQIRVSEDRWALNGCPDDGPAMAVDASGTVHLVWPTVLDGPKPEGALFYASSRDGRTFSPRVRVPTLGGPKPSHPQIVIGHDGGVILAWDESVDGRRVAAARRLQSRANQPATFGEPVRFAPDGVSQYPVLAASSSGLVAVWTTGGEAPRVEGRRIELP